MRVLHIMSGFGGGISSFILNKAYYFKDSTTIFDVMTFDEVPQHFLTAIENTGGRVYRISNPKVAGFKTYYEEVNSIMKNLPTDTFIHCHIRGYRALPFYLIAKKHKFKRFGIHAHTTGLPEEMNTLENKLVRGINNFVADEKISCGREASRYLFGEKSLRNKEIVHIPNSINAENFIQKYSVSKESLLGSEIKDKYVIGHIGRFNAVKNHIFMLDVIEKLSETSLAFVWLFIGDGDDFDKIKKIAKDRELDPYIKFLGRRNDIPQLLQIMDLFVLPSKYEGFPTVAVESQASGTKTLLSDTITKDVDLQLNLIEFLTITKPDSWVKSILSNITYDKVAPPVRLERLKKQKLTNKESAELYQAFLEQKITHYELN